VHPRRHNPQNAYLFPSHSNRSKYKDIPLTADSLRLAYCWTIEEHFPKVLLRPNVSVEEKAALKSLIYDKPHYPYLRRHEFATENVRGIDPDAFNRLMGHSKNSRMREVYVHGVDTDGITELQIKRGLITRDETLSPARLELQPKYCPMCKEANKQNADFCFSCNWVLSKKGMEEVKQQDAELTQQIKDLRESYDSLKAKQQEMINKAVIFDRLDNWIRSSGNPKDLEMSIWQFLDEEDPAGHKAEDFPELVAAAKRLRALRQAEKEKEKK
jgi:hypothetical protein